MHAPWATTALVAFAAAAACLGWAEASAVAHSRGSVPARMALLAEEHPTRIWSLRATRAALLNCDRALSFPHAELRGRTFRKAALATCEAMANDTLRMTDGHALAHIVLARVAGHAGDTTAQRTHLAASARLAPSEGWLAERRFVLAVGRSGDVPAVAPYELRADLGTLLRTQSGAELLAVHYLRRPAVRDLLTAAVDAASGMHRKRFVNLLRKGLASS